jgi:hypothetical protein
VLTLELPDPSPVDAAIYDLGGRRVATLHSGPLPAGPQRLEWNGLDARGRRAPPGVYFARVRSGLAVKSTTIVRES